MSAVVHTELEPPAITSRMVWVQIHTGLTVTHLPLTALQNPDISVLPSVSLLTFMLHFSVNQLDINMRNLSICPVPEINKKHGGFVPVILDC